MCICARYLQKLCMYCAQTECECVSVSGWPLLHGLLQSIMSDCGHLPVGSKAQHVLLLLQLLALRSVRVFWTHLEPAVDFVAVEEPHVG